MRRSPFSGQKTLGALARAARNGGTKWHVDTGALAAHFVAVKRAIPVRERKTRGTLIVEQHRPMMNKLTDAERQRMMRAGMELIYGTPVEPQPAHRRR
jgi:hypothetical protein